MTLRNVIIRIKSDKHNRRWKIREATSLKAAYHEIIHAQATGSIGSKKTVDDSRCGGSLRVIADVIEIHSDNTERVAYDKRY